VQAPVSPVKRLFDRHSVLSSWLEQLFEDFSAVKRSSENEEERYLLGFASIRDVYEYFIAKANSMEDQVEKNFYVQNPHVPLKDVFSCHSQ
jgi:hypothetical protein